MGHDSLPDWTQKETMTASEEVMSSSLIYSMNYSKKYNIHPRTYMFKYDF